MKFNKKKLTKKVKAVMHQDIVVSVAMVSIMINVFFFSGVLLFASTNRIDLEVFDAAKENLCSNNYDQNLGEVLNEANDKVATKALFEVKCQSGEFQR